MIHFTCDGCQRPIRQDEVRYVVSFEVYAACDSLGAVDCDAEADRDHLDEIHEILQHVNEPDQDNLLDAGPYERRRYDLCAECRKRFLHNPLRIESVEEFQFSQN